MKKIRCAPLPTIAERVSHLPNPLALRACHRSGSGAHSVPTPRHERRTARRECRKHESERG